MQSADVDVVPTNIPFFHSVRGKLALLLVLVVALTTISLSYASYSYVYNLLRSEIHRELQIHVRAVKKLVEISVQHHFEQIELILTSTEIRSLLERSNRGDLGSDELAVPGKQILDQASTLVSGIVDLSVANTAGVIVMSTESNAVGLEYGLMHAFVSGQQEKHFDLPPNLDEPVVLALPIKYENGMSLGVIFARFEAKRLLDSLVALSSGYNTGSVRLGAKTDNDQETRLFYADFKEYRTDLIGNDRPMRQALEGKEGFDEIQDANGKRVLAAYLPIPDFRWGLVTQVDSHEAYSKLDQTRMVVIIIGMTFFVLAAITGVFVAVRFLNPIVRLSNATSRFAENDDGYSVKVQSRDEVGALTRNFNAMMHTVRRHKNEMENTVHERTQKLEESRNQLAELCLALEGHVDLTERDLRRAEVIQRSLLPREWPRIEGYRFLGAYLPGHNVGGDLYDIVRIDSKFFVAFIADAAGHGVSAALLAVLFRKRLEMADSSGKPLAPHKVLADINKALMADISAPGVFVSSAYCLIDTSTGECLISVAGHPPIVHLKANGEIKSIEASGPAIGLYSDATFSESQIQLERGDRLLMYTDGLFPGPISRAQDLDRLKTAITSLKQDQKLLDQIVRMIPESNRMDDPDDMTVLIVEAANGVSSIDHKDLMVGAAIRSGQIEAGPPQIAYTENERATFLFLQGRMSWIHCQAFFDTATGIVDSGRKLVIDLSECTYLDSAMLGTLHEIAQKAAAHTAELVLQNVSYPIRKNFTELGMHAVIESISVRPQESPDKRNLVWVTTTDPRSQKLRLLRAHEVLAELNVHNREEFGDVLDELRQDIVSNGNTK